MHIHLKINAKMLYLLIFNVAMTLVVYSEKLTYGSIIRTSCIKVMLQNFNFCKFKPIATIIDFKQLVILEI